AAWLMSKLVTRSYGNGAVIAVLIVLCGGGLLRLPSMGMEVPIVILVGAVASWRVFHCADRLSGSRPWALAGVGLLGSLARSDFVLLPLCMWAGQLGAVFYSRLTIEHKLEGWRSALPSPSLVTGSVIGSLFILGHSWLVSGNLLQGSINIKRY